MVTLVAPKSFASEAAFILSWPTPNPAFAQGHGYHTFLQKTGPEKDFSSGAYGCVRNNGYKFHEGIDLFPVKRSTRGKPLDSVFSAMAGRVAYINQDPRASSYGKYLVLEHMSFAPTLYTLYAHLDSFSPKLVVGKKVEVAEVLGDMGNSSSFAIPQNRAHLHFEVGLRLSDRFQNWYNRKTFTSPNKHGNFNGFNLVGLDPLLFFKSYQSGNLKSPADYIGNLQEVVRVLVKSDVKPSILKINPSLSSKHPEDSETLSWVCSFGPHGIPLNFEPTNERGSQNVEVIYFNDSYKSGPCRKLVVRKNNQLLPSEQLQAYLEILFTE